MSRYVLPHKRKQLSADELADVNAAPFQQAAWQALNRSITSVVNRVSGDNVVQSSKELFRENIIRGRGLLARCLMRAQSVDHELTPVLCSLVSCINRVLPHVVLLLCKRLVMAWKRALLRKDFGALEGLATFLCGLYVFEVVDVGIIYQMLLRHLMDPAHGEEDVAQAAHIFRHTFKAMAMRNPRQFHEQVLTPFRTLLAMDEDFDGGQRLSARGQAVLESCLKEVQQWERHSGEQALIPPSLETFDLHGQTTHELDAGEDYDTEDVLDRFVMDKEYQAHEDQYEVTRCAVLGDGWATELLEQVAAAESDSDAEHDGEEEDGIGGDDHMQSRRDHGGGVGQEATSVNAPPTEAPKPIVDPHERETRKQVYMALRSSIRADEAVHKILRSMQPQTERSICFMVVEGCCEERSYRKLYAMAAERLCKSNARFQTFFAESFRERYLGATDLTVKQIEYSCHIFVHLLRTDSLYWSRCLTVLDIVDNDESQRLFLQQLLQGLVEAMGMTAVVRRLLHPDGEVFRACTKLFPIHREREALEFAINLYQAMNLPELTAPLRQALEQVHQGAPTQRRRVE